MGLVDEGVGDLKSARGVQLMQCERSGKQVDIAVRLGMDEHCRRRKAWARNRYLKIGNG
jgi:hypothetical protein